MNSFASISFTLLFLVKGMSPGIDLGCELQKLPNLFTHYEEHKVCNDGSFWQFLINDYLNVDGKSEADHDDSNNGDLPFHGNHQCCHTSAFYASNEHFSLMVPEHAIQAEFAFYKSLGSTEFLDSPFQPPKA